MVCAVSAGYPRIGRADVGAVAVEHEHPSRPEPSVRKLPVEIELAGVEQRLLLLEEDLEDQVVFFFVTCRLQGCNLVEHLL